MSDVGTKISEFSEFSIQHDIENKILLVLEPTDNGDQNYKDRFITFSNFEKNIIEYLTEYAEFGDMIYQNKDKYSKYVHNHDQYSLISSVVVNDDFDNNEKIASIKVDNISYDIHQNFEIPNYKRDTEIGELKFIAVQNINTNIDIYSDDFDGWVYADGKTYVTKSQTDFSKAKENFITLKDGLSFKVPNLNNFIRPTIEPLQFEDNYTSFVQSNTLSNIPFHTHGTKFKIPTSVNAFVDTDSTVNKDGKGILFSRSHGDNGTKKIDVPSTVHIDRIQLGRMNTYEEGYDVGETYPKHNLLPVMIYIGERT